MTAASVLLDASSSPALPGHEADSDSWRGPCGDVVPPARTGVLGDFDDEDEFGESDEDVVRPIGDVPSVEEEDDFDEDDFDDDFDDDFESYDYEEEIVEEGSEIAEGSDSDIDIEKVLAGESLDEEGGDMPIEEAADAKEKSDDAPAEEEEEDDFDDE